jgi:hypothetical protein
VHLAWTWVSCHLLCKNTHKNCQFTQAANAGVMQYRNSMKNYLWALYGAVLVSLFIIGSIHTFTAGKGVFIGFISLAFGITYLIGLYGYVKSKVISTRKTWRVLFYINVFGLSMSLISFLLVPNQALAIDLIFKIIISIPLLIAIYRYSSLDNDIWNNTELAKKVGFLIKEFEHSSKITSNLFGMDTNIFITLEHSENEFSAQIAKGEGEDAQRFSNTFDNLEALVGFVESNSTADIYAFKSNA